MKPRLLDLFCGAGGAAMGYHRAGFEVLGVDIRPQPRYPFEFVQADALEFPLEGFDVIHASPPCQLHVRGLRAVNELRGHASDREDLIPPARDHLIASGLPYVIENVEGAPLRHPVKLCGSSFGLPIRRHRFFESNLLLLAPPCNHSWQNEPRYWSSFAHPGKGRFSSAVVQVYGNGSGHELWPEAMEIDWMRVPELTQAIPPAYTELIGHQLMQHITRPALSEAGREVGGR